MMSGKGYADGIRDQGSNRPNPNIQNHQVRNNYFGGRFGR